MNLLVLGSGGREHALAWAASRSSLKPGIFSLPGNPGLARLGTTLPGDPSHAETVLAAVRDHGIDLVLVGPEAPLVAGLADRLDAHRVPVFGPRAAAARIEGSKIFAKELMRRARVPTAGFHVASDPRTAFDLAAVLALPHVIKADGLAAGKGALIVRDRQEARAAVEALMIERRFGAAGDRILFEEFLEGEEMSVFALAAGEHYCLLPSSQDYKRALDGDAGPNTGGMGAYAPVVGWDAALEQRVRAGVIEPTLAALAREGCAYTGLLYCGLMVRDGIANVIEFNCRFGDPETQAVVPVLQGDLLETIREAADPAALRRGLSPLPVAGGSAVCVVMAAEGYPGSVKKGAAIEGLEEAERQTGVLVFQAGTAMEGGRLVAAGGRVLNVVGVGEDLGRARERAYAGVERIRFAGSAWRRDIAWRGLAAPWRGGAN
ncbi:MAG: phosphoribosylamine--glycine ligase [Candidatus Eisenbacteria bacterium]